MAEPALHGLIAEFATPEALVTAATDAYAEGYRRMDAYAPFPVEGLAAGLGRRRTGIPPVVLGGGILGGTSAYFLQYYAMAVDYPLNVGGRPLHSWPAFVPVTFELTVLAASLSGLLAMLIFNGLPRLHHPVFDAANFERASIDRFFLCIEAGDARFDVEATREFLRARNPLDVTEVRA